MKPLNITQEEAKDNKHIQYAHPLTVQERIRIAESLFGILTPDITLEQAKEERLNNI